MMHNDSAQPPSVSVAIATYNGEKFIRQQIDSILSQSMPPFEVVISDDCSTDNTLDILAELMAKYPKLRIIKNKRNLGFVKNFEQAMRACSGDYIAICDQDDVWLQNKLERLVNAIGENFLVHSDAALIDEKGEIFCDSFSKASFKNIKPTSITQLVLNGYVTGCTSMISREFLRSIDQFPETLDFHDRFVGFLAWKQGKIAYCPEVLTLYRQHGSNVVGAGRLHNGLIRELFKYLISGKLFKPNPDFKNHIRSHFRFLESIKPYIDKTEMSKLKDVERFMIFCLDGRGLPIKSLIKVYPHLFPSMPGGWRFLMLLAIIKNSKISV
jgi:glycosyltransferase involved in cell wall biosynthesis